MIGQNRMYASNINKYFLCLALKGFGFGLFIATWVIYMTERRGLTLAQAALVDTTFWVAAALGEVPTGIVADRWGRKTSLVIGTAMISLAILGWALAPTLPLIILAYLTMGLGMTFLSGAEEALFYESVQLAGRSDDYTRLIGRAGAIFPGAMALGSVSGGFLATIDLIAPYIVSTAVLATLFGVTLTYTETLTEAKADGAPHKSFGAILRESATLLRTRPTLRYPILYIALVPLTSYMVEGIFLQPQALAVGVPLAGLGLVVMAMQLTGMFGSAMSSQVRERVGENRILYAAPVVIILVLIALALLQIWPALVLVAVISFSTAVLRPIVMSRIQNQVNDDVRATVISMQSLTFTLIAAIAQPTLGYVADQAGLPAAYVALAVAMGLIVVTLLRLSRGYFPQPVVATGD